MKKQVRVGGIIVIPVGPQEGIQKLLRLERTEDGFTEKVLADVIARFRRQMGDRVHFLTGVDEHGQKVQASARQRGIPPGHNARREGGQRK